MRVGEYLVAVENGSFLPRLNVQRIPRRLVVEAQVVWLTSGFMHVRLPEIDILFNHNRVRLPAATLKLVREPWRPITHKAPHAAITPEWLRQPFYPRLNGNSYAANLADYYPHEAWSAFEEHLVGAQPQRPIDRERLRLAQQLGVEADADRKTVNAAFRLKIKRVHPDAGGDPDEFQNLIRARNALLSYDSP